MNQTVMRVVAIVVLAAIVLFLLSVLWDPINSMWR